MKQRIDIIPFNDKGESHGKYTLFHENGNVKEIGHAVNGKYTGYCEYYHYNGHINRKCTYIDGMTIGYMETWFYGKINYKRYIIT